MAVRNHSKLTIAKLQSKLTNGSSLVADTDGRTAWMRRYRDLVSSHEHDLGGTGFISESERRLIRRAALITIQCEMLDKKFASSEGEATREDLDLYQRLSNSLRRLLQSLGLQRRPRDINPPTLQQ